MNLHIWSKIALPSLSTDEKQRLKDSINKHGLRHPIFVLPDGRIIDGKHRYEILAGNIPDNKIEILDISDEEAENLAYSLNLDRRQLSNEQLKELREKLDQTAVKLHNQGMTLKKASQITGVPKSTISRNARNSQMGNTSTIPDISVLVVE